MAEPVHRSDRCWRQAGHLPLRRHERWFGVRPSEDASHRHHLSV